jgi:hypothetical protein
MKLLTNTNGIGHLIMSIVSIIAAIILIIFCPGNEPVLGVAVSIILTVNGYWFVPSAARQIASEVVNQINKP